MPLVHFHLADGTVTPAQQRRLLVEASRAYADALDSPVQRVRAFVVRYDPAAIATAGIPLAEGGSPAPYFTAIVLAGRPLAQRQRLAVAFTDLLTDVLGVDRALIRGRISEVAPEDWFIAGEPAARVRAAEIASRA